MSHATSWSLVTTGAGGDTQTVTIGGVVFTTRTVLGALAGSVALGINQAATLVNLAALINDPATTTITGVALSAADINTIKHVLGLTAVASATEMTITSSTGADITVSETETNFSWTAIYTSQTFGCGPIGKSSLHMVLSNRSSGSGIFVVQSSNDGSNWATYNRLTTNVVNAITEGDVRVASVTLNSDTSTLVTLPDPYAFNRVVLTMAVDGKYQASVYLS